MRYLSLLICCLFTLIGCGQSGDLYLASDKRAERSRFIFEPSKETDYYSESDAATADKMNSTDDFVPDDQPVIPDEPLHPSSDSTENTTSPESAENQAEQGTSNSSDKSEE